MVVFVTDYIHSCLVCSCSKALHHKLFSPHQFLPIRERPWDSISMDFVEGLHGHDTILVVFAKHGTPTDIISDWGKHFISRFWQSLCQLLGIKANLSTAYHPETDDQTERVIRSW